MAGWLVLVTDVESQRELALWGLLEAADLPDVERVESDAPAGATPHRCWCFSAQEGAVAAVALLASRGYAARETELV